MDSNYLFERSFLTATYGEILRQYTFPEGMRWAAFIELQTPVGVLEP